MPGSAAPKWFTPARLLFIFCLTNLVVYLDRGLIASNGVNGSPRSEEDPAGSGIQGAFDLSYFEDGMLPALFMVGLLLSSPIFAECCKHYNAFRLLGIGMAVWCVAAICSGLSPNFPLLLIARAFVGVGEASFVALAAPFIDDYAPVAKKTQWFAMFFLCIPVGFALGYICGGIVATYMSWRWGFILEGLAMIPFVIFALTAQPLKLQGSAAPGSAEEGYAKRHFKDVVAEFWADVKTVFSQRVWVHVNMAYTLYVAVLGVYAFWGPQAGKALFFPPDDKSAQADYVFGGVTVLTGVLGSLAGGIFLDRAGSSLRNANLLCAISNVVGLAFLLLAFNVSRSFSVFMALFAVGQFVIFLLQAPVAALGMWCVPPTLRPLGASLMTVCIHLFGDVPSPPITGAIQSHLADGKPPEQAVQQWRLTLSLVSLLLLGSGAFFLRAALLSSPASDFRTRVAGAESGSPDKPHGHGHGGHARGGGGSAAGQASAPLLDPDGALSDESVAGGERTSRPGDRDTELPA